MTPSSWVPFVIKPPPTPQRYGSAPRPSQLRPPRAILPNGPIKGPSAMWIPFPRYSLPRAFPYLYMRSLSKVAPRWMPAGNAEINSCPRMPSGASAKQSSGMLRRGTAPVWPTHGPVTPWVRFDCSSCVSWATMAFARAYAAAQAADVEPCPCAKRCQYLQIRPTREYSRVGYTGGESPYKGTSDWLV